MAHENNYELSHVDKIAMPIVVKAFVIYELDLAINRNDVINSITEGLANATTQCPFMAGKIYFNDSGKPIIKKLPNDRLQCTIQEFAPSEHKSFHALQESCFPPEEFNNDRLLPSFPVSERPVSALQLNFIENGLILAFAINHIAGDWSSMNSFLSLVCQGSKAYQQDLSMPTYAPDLNRSPFNGDPHTNIPQSKLLKGCPGFFVDENAFIPPKMPPQFSTGIYKITNSAVKRLKQECTEMLNGVDYVTSYDCIAALLWVTITRVRAQLNRENISLQSRFLHPIDLRSRDPEHRTSPRYFGNAVFPSQAGPIDVETLLAQKGLGAAASLIRKSINEVSMASIENLTTLVASLAPAERLGFHANFFDMDVLFNSWFSGKATDFAIGSGLVPRAFRTHRPITGACCLILPNFSLEEITSRLYDIFVQLDEREHRLLRQDSEFLDFFEIKV
ncbi:hypothetical protein N7478_009204 [Penicillium angulare]|uniref:uncharacterized protein n=1 Tax=Penicillium angulare TaxID=116970 RepID=UPI002540B47A|nr:uncharacterized protein N7478_009204 [Penicillium angulare]KAJ5274079.1 hypothetical protein N7478_009204 [Penicillium angulare]